MKDKEQKKSVKKYVIIVGIIIILVSAVLSGSTEDRNAENDPYFGGFLVGLTTIIVGCCLKSQKKT